MSSCTSVQKNLERRKERVMTKMNQDQDQDQDQSANKSFDWDKAAQDVEDLEKTFKDTVPEKNEWQEDKSDKPEEEQKDKQEDEQEDEQQEDNESDKNPEEEDREHEKLSLDKKKPKKFNATELEAIKKGWVPKSEFKGSIDEWRSAKEFMDRGELLEVISRQNRDLKKMRTDFEQFNESFAKKTQKEENLEIYQLKEAKKRAIESGDVQTVEQIDNALSAYPYQSHNNQQYHQNNQQYGQNNQQNNQPVDPLVSKFEEENKDWYNHATPENFAMKMYAISKDSQYRESSNHLSSEEILKKVKEDTVNQFPNYFRKDEQLQARLNRSNQNYQTVEAGHASNKPSKREITYLDLPNSLKNMIKNLSGFEDGVPNCGKKRDRYARRLLEIGAVKYN